MYRLSAAASSVLLLSCHEAIGCCQLAGLLIVSCVYLQSRLLASSAPMTMFSYFAQAACACQRMPQSVPAMTFSRPQTFAKLMIVSETTSGGSTTGVVWSTTPGMMILSSGHLNWSRQICHSSRWVDLADASEKA